MKKLLYSLSLFLGLTLSSCFGDLNTMPLDENQLVTEKVYSTPEGYTGVLAKCYASLIQTVVPVAVRVPTPSYPAV